MPIAELQEHSYCGIFAIISRSEEVKRGIREGERSFYEHLKLELVLGLPRKKSVRTDWEKK